MNRTSSSSHRWQWVMPALVVGFAILLVTGPALTVTAGPTQEKGQEEPKENKDKPKKFTNDDLKKVPSSSDSRVPAVADDGEDGDPAGEDAEAVDPWASVGVATDSGGRGEAYWRQAMTEAKAAVDSARKNHDLLQGEMDRNKVDFTAIDDPAARALVHERIEELFTQLAEAKQALTDAEQALRDLQEDARRSGALPGWLR